MEKFTGSLVNLYDIEIPDPTDINKVLQQNVSVGIPIRVYKRGVDEVGQPTVELADIFATDDRESDPINYDSFRSDENGEFSFYAPDGRYNVVINQNTDREVIWDDVLIVDTYRLSLQGEIELPDPNEEWRSIIEDIGELIGSLYRDGVDGQLKTEIDISAIDNEGTRKLINGINLEINDITNRVHAMATSLLRVDVYANGATRIAKASRLEAQNLTTKLAGAITDIQQLKINANGSAEAMASLTLELTNLVSGMRAINERMSLVELDVDGNARAIEALKVAVGDTSAIEALISRMDAVELTNDGQATAISTLQGTVNDETTGMSATYSIANQAKLSADEVSSRMELIATAEQDGVMAIAGIKIHAGINDGTVVTQMRFIGDTIEFVKSDGTQTLYYDNVADEWRFKGSIYAENIIGDVTDSVRKFVAHTQWINQTSQDNKILFSVKVDPLPFARTCVFSGLHINYIGTDVNTIIISDSIGGNDIEYFRLKAYDDNATYRRSLTYPSVSVEVPANTEMNLQFRLVNGFVADTGVPAASYNTDLTVEAQTVIVQTFKQGSHLS